MLSRRCCRAPFIDALIVVLFLFGGGCKRHTPVTSDIPPVADSPAPLLKEVAAASSIDFVHDTGPAGRYRFPEIMGSGCALLDYDNDGRLDLLLLQNGGANGPHHQLYHQEPDGRFRDASAGSGLDLPGYGMGVAVGDINNDGFVDVLITEYGGLHLFLNNGDGTFRDATSDAGLTIDRSTPPWFTSAAFLDYDRDGYLDLVVTQYVVDDPSRVCTTDGKPDYCSPSVFAGGVTRLFHNQGNEKSTGPQSAGGAPSPPRFQGFEDVTISAGFATKPGPGLGVVCRDFDGDGWPDILIANDGRPNHLWMNRHDGTFREEGNARGLALNAAGQTQGNMGIAVTAVRGGDAITILMPHLTEELPTLWLQQPGGGFRDETAASGLEATAWRGTGFGVVFADLRNNGLLQVAVANGRVVRRSEISADTRNAPDMPVYWQPYAERNQLFSSNADGRFTDISQANPAFCGTPNVGRGLVAGDIYNDGGIDLLMTRAGGSAAIFRNAVAARGHWVTIRCIDPALGGRDAYGAKVTITAGGTKHVGWVDPGGSYLSSGDPRVHFGLGNVAQIDRIDVVWPDGSAETFKSMAVDGVRALRRGDGEHR